MKIRVLIIDDHPATAEGVRDLLQSRADLIPVGVATGSTYLEKFVGTLRNWWHEFLNYFNAGVTQGFVEGINHAIRDIIRRAFGYRNFGNFRLQVLVECDGSG